MPATPLYAHRLLDGIAVLEMLDSDWVDRRMVEEALDVGKWTAWRILKRCGAREGPGRGLICRRNELISQLKALAEDGQFAPEIARRRRVEEYLDDMARYVRRRQKQIGRKEDASELRNSRLARLPAGVDLEAGELRIQFAGSEDFLRKFGAVVFALNNDYEEICAFIDGRKRGY